jgi:hypothetical protein
MAKLSVKGIQDSAKQIIADNPGGIRYSELVKKIIDQNPETPENTIMAAVWNLHSIFPAEIAKPSRGLFTPAGQIGDKPGRHWKHRRNPRNRSQGQRGGLL